jgi:ketosteroid isomerase-like protein
MDRRTLAAAGLGLAAAASPALAAASPRRGRTARRLSAEDRVAIEDLFSNYVWAYDCTDADEFISLFTDDALVVGRGKLYSDRAAILSWFQYLIDMREAEGDDIWMHEAGQFRVEPQADDRAIVYAYATHLNGRTSTQTRGVRSLGYFVCECVKVGGVWKFRRFSITTWDRNALPWKKPLPWASA